VYIATKYWLKEKATDSYEDATGEKSSNSVMSQIFIGLVYETHKDLVKQLSFRCPRILN
jgi:hypothetical protein